MATSQKLILRLYHPGGQFRIELPSEGATLKDLWDQAEIKNPSRGRRAVFTLGNRPGGAELDYEAATPLHTLGFKRGQQIYMNFMGDMSVMGKRKLEQEKAQNLEKKMSKIPVKGHVEPYRQYVYKEDQYSAMCGMHAINSLLQSHGESEKECEAVARDLESRFMSQTGMKEVGDQFRDEHGNYNIAVIQEALKKRNIQLTPLEHPSMELFRRNPTTADGFLLNRAEHWFAIRRVHGKFWTLDSCQPLPEFCGDTYLEAKIATMRASGYTIYVCQGVLPNPKPSQHSKNQLYDVERVMWEAKRQSREASKVQAQQHSAALQQLINLGMFPQDVCERALTQAGGNAENAANLLLSGQVS